ncbi:hypothetical protein Trydic_g10597, partial [Trypoxylus dichotomus]
NCNLGESGGACLDYNFNINICYNVTTCDFIFYCPKNFVANYTECYRSMEGGKPCPAITSLTYTISFNRDYITMANYQQTTVSPEQSLPCVYSIEDMFSIGESPKIFELQFDRIIGEITLTTSFHVGQNAINCYGRNHHNIQSIEVVHKPSASRTRQFFRRYNLKITPAPNIYFCSVGTESSEFALTRTSDVVGYSNTSPEKYIAKITLKRIFDRVFDIVTYISQAQCLQVNLAVCKIMKVENTAIFFYIQDLKRREFEVIRDILNQTLILIVNSFAQSTEKYYEINYLQNIEYCLPDTTTSGGRELTWSTTLVGTTVTPSQLCLNNDGMQVTRRCEGDFFTGARWSEPSGVCSETFEVPKRTYRLHQFIQEEAITEVFTNITAETNEFEQFTTVDVNLLSDGLKMMSMRRNIRGFKNDFFHGISNVMRVNSSVLRNSQEQLNSTDKILNSIENFVLNIAGDIKNLSVTIDSNLLTQISYPFLSNVVGLAIYSNGQSNFSNYTITSLLWEETFDNLALENLELAVYIPTDYIRNLTENFTVEEKNTFKIINTVFYNDGLFNDLANENRSAGSRVVNVNIPGLDDSTEIPIHLLFRPVLNFVDSSCAFWDYGRQRTGAWSTSGGRYMGAKGESLLLCSFNHITHFALLVLSGNIMRVKSQNDVTIAINPLEAHNLALTLITLIGCGLSVIGLAAIVLTTILFKDWYKKRLNTIQLGIVMLMEIIILYVADLKVLEGSACLAIGALLHYIVVSKFVWMLIIARIQYLRFVKIFDSLQVKSHVIAHMLTGWILPMIPVMLGLFIFPADYQVGKLNFCYAQGYTLHFFIILPITIIILGNIAVFIAIMVNVSKSRSQNFGVNLQKIQVRLGIMLLFMLGITWIFGIIGEFLPWDWLLILCSYIFCILGSIHGFVLFVFMVLLDKTTMELWAGLLKIKTKRDIPYGVTRNKVAFRSNNGNVNIKYFGKRN